jgi:hypothetical protein
MKQLLRTFLLGSLIASASVALAGTPPDLLEKYCNSRFGFCVEYPGSFLTQKYISENNDGVAVLSADADIQLRVYGYFNVMGWSLQEEYQDFLTAARSDNGAVKELEIEFQEDQFSVLLQVGDKLHFERTLLKGNHFISLSLEVNSSGKHSFEDSRVQMKQLLEEIKLTLN